MQVKSTCWKTTKCLLLFTFNYFLKKAGEFFAKVTQTELWKNIQIRIHVFVNKEACQLEKWEFTDVFWVKTEEKVLATQNPHCHFIGMVT